MAYESNVIFDIPIWTLKRNWGFPVYILQHLKNMYSYVDQINFKILEIIIIIIEKNNNSNENNDNNQQHDTTFSSLNAKYSWTCAWATAFEIVHKYTVW